MWSTKETYQRSQRVVLGLCVVFLLSAVAQGRDKAAATADYEKGLRQLRSGDLNVDFKKLRFDCAASKHECQTEPEEIKQLFILLKDKKFDAALQRCNKNLQNVFVDAELHYIAFIANSELGKKEEAEFHKAVASRLLDSIQDNKKGRSEDDAFAVINVHEEYTFLRFSNMGVSQQSLLKKNGHSYDMMVCAPMGEGKGEEVTVYFNIDIPEQQLTDALGK